MYRNQIDQYHDAYFRDRSNQNSNDDYNILEPSADIDLNFPDYEEDEISDFSLMDSARVVDCED